MNTPTPHENAAELASIIKSIPAFLAAKMARAFHIANTLGQEQAIMDAMPAFGEVPARSLQIYAVLRGALAQLDLAGDLPPADTVKFSANADGSVSVVIPAPVTPSIAP